MHDKALRTSSLQNAPCSTQNNTTDVFPIDIPICTTTFPAVKNISDLAHKSTKKYYYVHTLSSEDTSQAFPTNLHSIRRIPHSLIANPGNIHSLPEPPCSLLSEILIQIVMVCLQMRCSGVAWGGVLG